MKIIKHLLFFLLISSKLLSQSVVSHDSIWFYTNNPVLSKGIYGKETDKLHYKCGDGITHYNSLSYVNTISDLLTSKFPNDPGMPFLSKVPQPANYVYASPNGSSGVPTFRALVAGDLPGGGGGAGTVTSVGTGFGLSGGPITTSGTLIADTSANKLATQYYARSHSGTGTVTSVAMSTPTGLSISGSPITTSGTLALSLTSGYAIPTTSEISTWNGLVTMTYPGAGIPLSTGSAWGTSITNNSSNWNTAYGWGNHASAGYYVGTASTIKGLFSNTATGLTYNSTSGATSLTSGYVIPTTTEETNWNTAYTNRITSLTTTGSSGSATLSSNTLNIPTYTLAGLGGGTWATLNYPSWSSGTPFVKMTAAGTFSLDANTYLTSVGTGTTNELTYWSGTNTLGSLTTSTYPNLTELSYIKGLTSSPQNQINTITGAATTQSRLRSAATSLTTATTTNVTATALTLGAGTWDISAMVGYLTGTTPQTNTLFAAVSQTSATLPATDTDCVPNSNGEVRVEVLWAANTALVSSSTHAVVIPTYRVVLSGSTTFYLLARAVFGTSTMSAFGSISARQVK